MNPWDTIFNHIHVYQDTHGPLACQYMNISIGHRSGFPTPFCLPFKSFGKLAMNNELQFLDPKDQQAFDNLHTLLIDYGTPKFIKSNDPFFTYYQLVIVP